MDTTAAMTSELADPLAPYRRWATVLFWILIVIQVMVGLIVFVAPVDDGAVVPVLVLALALGVVPLFIEVLALGRAEPWSVRAIRPICLVLVAFGVLRVAVALTEGDITIPLEAIGALLVLSREHGARYLPAAAEADRWRIYLVVSAVILANLVPYVAAPIADGRVGGVQVWDLELVVAP